MALLSLLDSRMWNFSCCHLSQLFSLVKGLHGGDKKFTRVNWELDIFQIEELCEKVPGMVGFLVLVLCGRICSCDVRLALWNEGVEMDSFLR